MKKLFAIALSVFVFITAFSGCDFKISDLIKITPITTAAKSTAAAQQETVSSLDDVLTSLQETQNSAADTDGNNSSTSKATTTKPMQTTTTKPVQTTTNLPQTTTKPGIQKDGAYTTKEDVSLYIHTYKKLPNNFITKEQARALKWPGGDLEPYAPGKCIGGSYFGNYPDDNGVKPFPEASGRKFFECDIDTLGAHDRGPKRLVYSNDGLIYYTPDHYETFIQMY